MWWVFLSLLTVRGSPACILEPEEDYRMGLAPLPEGTPREADGWVSCSVKNTCLAPAFHCAGDLSLPTVDLCYEEAQLSIRYDTDLRLPLLTSYVLRADQQVRAQGGRSSFRCDPDLDCGEEQNTSSAAVFEGVAYDRGHMAPSYAFSYDDVAKKQTYFMTNIAPQTPQHNQGPWRKLEALLSDYAVASNSMLLVMTGAAFNDTANIKRIEGSGVPDIFYKLVCCPASGLGAGIWSYNLYEAEDTEMRWETLEAFGQLDFARLLFGDDPQFYSECSGFLNPSVETISTISTQADHMRDQLTTTTPAPLNAPPLSAAEKPSQCECPGVFDAFFFLCWNQEALTLTNTRVCYAHFALGFSLDLRVPLLVGYLLHPAQQIYNRGGRSSFRCDPEFQCGEEQNTSDALVFEGTAYDRGHMAPSFSFSFDPQAKKDTYYMTNVSPQTPQHNQGPWRKLERVLSDFALARNSMLYVLTGVAYQDLEDVKRIDGSSVPDIFYKVVCQPSAQKGAGIWSFNLYEDEDTDIRWETLSDFGNHSFIVALFGNEHQFFPEDCRDDLLLDIDQDSWNTLNAEADAVRENFQV